MGSSRPSLRLNDKQAEKMVVQMAYLTLFLYDLSQGTSSTVLKTRYRFDVEALEEGLRDTVLWLLSGFEKTLEIRNFYFHLKSNCEADSTQVHTVDLAFKRLSRLTFGLMPNLKYRSTLGELIRGIKRTYPNAKSYPGERTIQRLEEAGIRNMHDLVGKTQKDIMTIGVERRYADLIVGYLARRSM